MNSFGRIFRLTIFGESHGPFVGITIDGVPPGIKITIEDFLEDIKRRNPYLKGTTERKEFDTPQILSGVYNNYSTGAPLTIIFANQNQNSSDYNNLNFHFRPGHADFTAYVKYKGFNDPRGGGHFSGRLTLPIVAAGVVAKKIIQPTTVLANIVEIYGKNNYDEEITKAQQEKDSLGGIIQCTVKNIVSGLGEPFFDSLESLLAHAIFSIPGIKGIEFGAGFKLASMKGSQANDLFINENGKTLTNNSGGILGGISSGNDICFRVVVKPPSSIGQVQHTYNWKNKKIEPLIITGRHDVCIALRIPVIIEAITACVLSDCLLIAKAYS